LACQKDLCNSRTVFHSRRSCFQPRTCLSEQKRWGSPKICQYPTLTLGLIVHLPTISGRTGAVSFSTSQRTTCVPSRGATPTGRQSPPCAWAPSRAFKASAQSLFVQKGRPIKEA
jgi:hypothetical protein